MIPIINVYLLFQPVPYTSYLTCSRCNGNNQPYSKYCSSCACHIDAPPRTRWAINNLPPVTEKQTFISRSVKFYQLSEDDGRSYCLTKNAQVTTSLLQTGYLTVTKRISGCVRNACSGLMITSLLQVDNWLDANWFSRLFIHKLDASCLNNLYQVYKY